MNLRGALLGALALTVSLPALALAAAPVYQPTATIVILGAVPQEIPPLVAALHEPIDGKLWDIPYTRGTLAGQPVVIAITGVGKTFAAMTTTLFLREFRPRLVLMTGTASRLEPELRTGDIIVAAVMHEHDFGSLGPGGMDYRPLKGPREGEIIENRFAPPAELLARAEQAIAAFPGDELSVDGATYRTRARLGVVASSDLFGVPASRIASLRSTFGADLMEMESAPFGAVCAQFGVPYLVVRAGSNVTQETPSDDYLRLGPIAAAAAARFTLHLMEYLG